MKNLTKSVMALSLLSLLVAAPALAKPDRPALPDIICAGAEGPYLTMAVFEDGSPARTKIHTWDDDHYYPPIENFGRVIYASGGAGTHVFRVEFLNKKRNKSEAKYLMVEFESLDQDPVHSDLVTQTGELQVIRKMECNLDRPMQPARR